MVAPLGHTGKRPWTVTAVAWLFILAGAVGFAYHASEADRDMWVLLVRLLAIVAGVFMLRGANWARWLGIAWIAYHVVLSAFHSMSETVAHAVLLVLISYGLLRPAASAYFRGLKELSS